MRRFLILWTLVLLVNVIVPIALASTIINSNSKLGMIVAILCFLFAGGMIGIRSQRLRRILIRGGIATALTQFFPVAQMIAGSIGLAVCRRLSLATDATDDEIVGRLDHFAGGFVCTMVTGGVITAFALVTGVILLYLFGSPIADSDSNSTVQDPLSK